MSFFERLKKTIFRKDSAKIFVEHGGHLGKNVVMFDTKLDDLFPWLITIGDNVTLTGVQVLAHDASTKRTLGYTKIGKVVIGDNVFIGRGSIILPNVTIGNNAVIGAGSIITKNIPDNSVAVGNPCRILKSYNDYINAEKENFNGSIVIDKKPKELSQAEIQRLVEDLNGIGYIR